MKIYFDKDLSTERFIEIKSFNENIIDNRLNGNYDMVMTADSTLPDISNLASNRSFSTIQIIDKNNIVVPLSGTYNYIANVSASYYEEMSQYQVNILVEYKESMTE